MAGWVYYAGCNWQSYNVVDYCPALPQPKSVCMFERSTTTLTKLNLTLLIIAFERSDRTITPAIERKVVKNALDQIESRIPFRFEVKTTKLALEIATSPREMVKS